MMRGLLAERVGFEPTLEFPLNTLSKRAPSATRPSLRREIGGKKTTPTPKEAFPKKLSAKPQMVAILRPFSSLQFYG